MNTHGQGYRGEWTLDAGGRSNSSSKFLHLVDEVERLIRQDAATLLAGRADMTARLIMAQLAHVHRLAPVDVLGEPEVFVPPPLDPALVTYRENADHPDWSRPK